MLIKSDEFMMRKMSLIKCHKQNVMEVACITARDNNILRLQEGEGISSSANRAVPALPSL